jgi:hypothetical protein
VMKDRFGNTVARLEKLLLLALVSLCADEHGSSQGAKRAPRGG